MRPAQSAGPIASGPRVVNQLFILLGISSWKPVITALLLPPVPLLVLMLLGTRLVLPRRGLGWLVVLTSVALMWLSCCVGSAQLLSQTLLRPPAALPLDRVAALKAAVQAHEPVAIMVLGGGSKPLAPEYGVSSLSEYSMERLRYGIWLGRETGAPVAFSGGVGWGERDGAAASEAQIASRIAAQDFGRPLKWTEERSRDTRENAIYSVPLLKAQGIKRVILVTHQAHMVRVLRAFEEVAQGGMQFEAAPVAVLNPNLAEAGSWLPSQHGFDNVHLVLHELIGKLSGA